MLCRLCCVAYDMFDVHSQGLYTVVSMGLSCNTMYHPLGCIIDLVIIYVISAFLRNPAYLMYNSYKILLFTGLMLTAFQTKAGSETERLFEK